MHHLVVKPKVRPRKQKLREMSTDQQEAAKDKVHKVGVIQEIVHPEWLENLILVKRSNGK